VRPRAVPPPEQSHSTQVDDDLSIDADADDDVSCASDSFDEDSTDDLPVGGTVDMDDAVRSTSTSSWSLRNLEGVMVGASWPLRQVAREVSQWSSSSFDDDDECDNTKRPMGRAIAYPASVDTDDVGKDDGEASETKRDEKKRTAGANGSRAEWTAWLSPSKWTATQLGWAARDKVNAVAAERRRDVRDETRTDRTGGSRNEEKKNNSKKTKKTKTKTDWRAAAASWIAEDDMETFFLSEPDPLGFGAFFTGVNAWAAGRLERNRASVWANSRPPALEIVNLSHADKARLGLGCDEMHFLPVPNSGWSIALLRYKAKAFDCRTDHVTWTTPCITSPDSMWDDSDFVKGAGGSHHEKMPCLFVPGCASNAYTFDVCEKNSLARKLAKDGHDVWIVECRGVGFARPWQSPGQWVDKEGTPKQHVPTFGDFDYDTYLREDLPVACGYVSSVCGVKRLCAVGHSMGGMLVMGLASGAVDNLQVRDIDSQSDARNAADEAGGTETNSSISKQSVPFAEWQIARAVTVASCLEVSDVSDNQKGHSSTYARYAAVAGIVPDFLYGGKGVPQLPLGPLSVGQGMAIEAIKGAPRDRLKDKESLDAKKDQESLKNETEDDDALKTFWERNAVSLSTCYPGATAPQNVRTLLYFGFGNVPLRLVLQMATLFAPGGLATRDETAARRDRAVDAASKRRAERRAKKSFKGWGDTTSAFAANISQIKAGDATVEEVVLSEMRAGSGSFDKNALYLNLLRSRRPKLLMLAGDCDPVIPPAQVAATALAAGARFVCFGDGPMPRGSSGEGETGEEEKGKKKQKANSEKPSDKKQQSVSRSESDAALEAMLVDGGTHFSHYDLLCGKRAPELVFPEVAMFLGKVELFGGRVEL